MKSTSIKTSLVNGLMLIVLFFLIQAGLVWYTIDSAKSSVVESVRKNTVATSELNILSIYAQQIRRYEKEYFIYVTNKEKRDSYEKEWRETMGKIDATLVKVKTGINGAFSPKDIQQAAVWSEAAAFYLAEMQKIFLAVNERSAAIQAAKDAIAAATLLADPGVVDPASIVVPAEFGSVEVNGMIKAGKEKFAADFIKSIGEMEKAKTADTLALSGVAEGIFSQLLMGVLITVVIGIVVALLLIAKLPETVAKAIGGLSAAAHEMSMGNLGKSYDSGGVTEFDELAESLNRMRMGQQALVERLQKRH